MYSSTHPSTSELDGGWVANTTPRQVYSGKDLVRIVQVGWTPGSVCKGAENLASQPGGDPRTVQPLASRYTD